MNQLWPGRQGHVAQAWLLGPLLCIRVSSQGKGNAGSQQLHIWRFYKLINLFPVSLQETITMRKITYSSSLKISLCPLYPLCLSLINHWFASVTMDHFALSRIICKWIRRCVFFLIWLLSLSIIILRYTHAVVCSSHFYGWEVFHCLGIANLFILSPADIYFGYLFLLLKIKLL